MVNIVIWNNGGPITDPCGTPDSMCTERDVTPLSMTHCSVTISEVGSSVINTCRYPDPDVSGVGPYGDQIST